MNEPSRNPVASVTVRVTSAAAYVPPSLIVVAVAESIKDLTYLPAGIALALVP